MACIECAFCLNSTGSIFAVISNKPLRQGMDRQKSLNSSAGSPTGLSPLNHHARSSSASTALLKKPQNMQAVAAAQRLAKVMAVRSGPGNDEDEDEDLAIEYSSTGLGFSAGRAQRPRPSMPVRAPAEHPPPARMLSSGARPSLSIRTMEQPSIGSATLVAKSSPQPANSTEQLLPTHGMPAFRRTSVSKSFTQQNPPMGINPLEQPPFSRDTLGRHPHVAKLGTLVPPSTTISLKQPSHLNPGVSSEFRKDRRLSMQLGSVDSREPKEHNSTDIESRDSSVLQDELDMLQEDNESLLEKLRLAQKRCEEAEARAKQLENQVAGLGEGVSLEARLLSRKEAALQKRETIKDGATSTLEQLQESELELRSLRSAVQRLVLTQEEKEEVVLKRCWLARYWGLCVEYGIHPDIAGAKHEYWSSWAPLPFEVVVAAGMDAKEDQEPAVNWDLEERERMLRDVNQISGDSNAESMILVEKGLRELASLKVEDAVLLEMAQRRKRNVQGIAFSDETELPDADETRSPSEEYRLFDAFELSPEEAEDVQFKLAWLIYFWRRAKTHGLEDDIAEERLQTWIDQSIRLPTSHVAVDVERGMMELRKLGIETSLWEESRSWME